MHNNDINNQENIAKIKEIIDGSDSVLIGAGSGLSSAAGLLSNDFDTLKNYFQGIPAATDYELSLKQFLIISQALRSIMLFCPVIFLLSDILLFQKMCTQTCSTWSEINRIL